MIISAALMEAQTLTAPHVDGAIFPTGPPTGCFVMLPDTLY